MLKRLILLIFMLCAAMSCDKVSSETGGETPDLPPVGDDTEEGTVYAVGDLYSEGFIKGIVIATDEEGLHGMAISLDEVCEVWSYRDENVMNSMPSSDGMANTGLVFRMQDWRSNYPGFAWCADKNVLGIDKWFIPSPYEMYQLYSAYTSQSREWFNGCIETNGGVALSDAVYWTSSEAGDGIATPFDMSRGENIEYPADMLKSLRYNFRAFCTF